MRNTIPSLQCIMIIMMTAILAAFLLLAMTGCAEDSLLSPNDDPSKVYSATADDLMDNFVRAYGGQDLELYAQLLHDDFIYTFDPDCCSELGPVFEYFTREDELICAGNLFSGETVVNSRGQTVPAITGIHFHSWEREGSWELEANGRLRGIFQVDLLLTRQDSSDLRIRGRQIFTVAVNHDFREVGGGHPYYQIIGWQDLTGR